MKHFRVTALALTVCFLALSFTCDGVILWMMRRSPSCTATKIERAVTGGAGESIAIFGSSRALGNYVPSLLAPDAFNYGVNGMSLNEALLLVEQYLLHNPSDSTIIINLDPWGFANPKTLRLAGDYRLAGKSKHVRETIPGLDLSWPNWTPGLRFQGELRTAITRYINTKRTGMKRIDNGAEILLNSRSDEEWETIKKSLKPYSFFFFVQCRDLLKRVYAAQGDHRLIWVVAPSCPAHHDLHENPEGLFAFLQTQATEAQVITFTFFNETDAYPDTFFADPTRFNIWGAEKFTKALKAKLDSLPVL